MPADHGTPNTAPGLAEEVAWAINYLRGIQGEINDLHRDGRLKMWDRSRLHDLIRCVVDGVQGRVGLERALQGEVSTTAERSAGHGTPNTGDERDREVEVVARALTDYPDEWEEHDEGDKDVFRRMAADAIAALDAVRSPSRDGTVGEGHGAAEAKVLEVMASPSYATATDEQRAKWIVNHMARDGTVAVEDVTRDVLLRICERVMTFGGFQRTPRGEFWVARDDVIRLVDELLADTERIHDQATKEGER